MLAPCSRLPFNLFSLFPLSIIFRCCIGRRLVTHINVREPGLAALAPILEDGKEASDAIPAAAALAVFVASGSGRRVPVMVCVKALSGDVAHELGRANIVAAPAI